MFIIHKNHMFENKKKKSQESYCFFVKFGNRHLRTSDQITDIIKSNKTSFYK